MAGPGDAHPPSAQEVLEVIGKPGKLAMLGALAMILATAAAYAPSIGGSFLWDDDIFTYDSPVIRDGRCGARPPRC